MFLFLSFACSAEDLPLLTPNCGDGQTIDPFTYQCVDFAAETCTDDQILLFDKCFSISEIESQESGVIGGDEVIPFVRVRNGLDSYDVLNADPSDYFTNLTKFYGAAKKLATDGNQKVAEALAGLCVLSHYSQNSKPCSLLSEMYDQRQLGNMDYNFWPVSGPWLLYNSSSEEEILSERYLKSEFVANRVTTIMLAQWTIEGDFKGFKELTIDLEKCSVKNENNQLWRKFGSNFYSECYIDLYEEMNKTSTMIYEPFIVDNYNDTEKSNVLRPVPVLDLAYSNTYGQTVNRMDDTEVHKYARRFFLMDNVSTDNYVQFLQNFTFVYELRSDDSSNIYVPHIVVDYVQHLKSNIHEIEPSFNTIEDSLTSPKYSFRVVVTKNMDKFWEVAVITLTVLIILIIVFFIFRTLTFVKRHNGDGMSAFIMFGIFRYLFDYFANGFFIYILCYGIYYWCFFKLQASITTALPPGDEFERLVPMMWSCFAIKFVAVVFQLLMNTNSNIFVVDWETPHNDDQQVSAWRRIMVANQFCAISTCRSYSIPFTLILFLFIQIGFNVDLLSSPIPDTLLIDMGISQPILRVGWAMFIFLCIGVVQFFWCELIYWRFGGDPFLNFIDLCATSNISVMIIESPQYGYYIHGRSVHAHADETMQKMNQNLAKEALGVAGTRGLTAEDRCQTFEVFYEHEFRQRFMQVYYTSMASTGGSFFKQTAATIPQATIGAYADLNKMLTRFFDLSQSEYRLDVQRETPFTQSVLGISPSTSDTSIMAPTKEREFRKTMMYGIQWSLYIFYILLFCCIDMHIKKPAIAAFVVYILDLIIVQFFKLRAKANIARKSLLDNRFLE